MTALDKLNNYRAQHGGALSAGKIKEPLSRVLYWKQEYWLWTGVYRDAEHPSFVADVAYDELVKARVEYRLIIRRAWAQRWSDRAQEASYQNRVLEQA